MDAVGAAMAECVGFRLGLWFRLQRLRPYTLGSREDASFVCTLHCMVWRSFGKVKMALATLEVLGCFFCR